MDVKYDLSDILATYNQYDNIDVMSQSIIEGNLTVLADTYLAARENRHDFVVKMLSRILKFVDISMDRIANYFPGYKGSQSHLSPDLIKVEDKTITIIEVGVSSNPAAYRTTKNIKYAMLRKELEDFTKKKVKLEVCVISEDGTDMRDMSRLGFNTPILSFVKKQVEMYTKLMARIVAKAKETGVMSQFNVLTGQYGSSGGDKKSINIEQHLVDSFKEKMLQYEGEVEGCYKMIDHARLQGLLARAVDEDKLYNHAAKFVNENEINESKAYIHNKLCIDAEKTHLPLQDKSLPTPLLIGESKYSQVSNDPRFDAETNNCISIALDMITVFPENTSAHKWCKKIISVQSTVNPEVTLSSMSIKEALWGPYYDFIKEYNREIFLLKGDERKSYMANNRSKRDEAVKHYNTEKRKVLSKGSVIHLGKHHVMINEVDQEELKSMGVNVKRLKKNIASENRRSEYKLYKPNEDFSPILNLIDSLSSNTGEKLKLGFQDKETEYNKVYLSLMFFMSKDDSIDRLNVMKHLYNFSKLMTAVKFACTYASNNKSFTYINSGVGAALLIVGPGSGGFKAVNSKPFKLLYKTDKYYAHGLFPYENIYTVGNNTYIESKWMREPMAVVDTWSNMYDMFMPQIVYYSLTKSTTNTKIEDICLQVLLSLNSKKSTSVMLADFRYLFTSCAALSSNVSDLIKDKLDCKLKTKLDVFLWNSMYNKLNEICRSSKSKLVVSDLEDTERNEESKFSMPKLYFEGRNYSLVDTLNELYYSHLIEKDNRNPMHDQVKGVTNAIEYEMLYREYKEAYPRLFSVDQTKPTIFDIRNVLYDTKFSYIEDFVRASADAYFEEIGMNPELENYIIRRSGVFSTVSVLTNMNNSVTEEFGREKSLLSVLSYMMGSQSRLEELNKVCNEFYDSKIDIAEFVDKVVDMNLSILNEGIEVLNEDGFIPSFGISRKVQVGDFREIYVMKFKTRIVQKLIESYMSALASVTPGEYISKQSDKRPIYIEKDMKLFCSEADKKGHVVIYENADCSKWAPSSTCEEFIVFIEQASKYINKGFCGLVKRFFKGMLVKQLQLPDKVVKKAKDFKGSSVSDFILSETKGGVLEYRVSFMMGIFNYFSSIKHVAKSALLRKYIKNIVETEVCYNSYEHSDDSFKMISAKDNYTVIKTVHVERVLAKLCNIKYNAKKTNFSYYIAEFLSVYYYNRSLSIPYIKFIRSIRDNLNYKTYTEDFYSLMSRCVEAYKRGTPGLLIFLMMKYSSDMLDRNYGLDSKDFRRYDTVPELFGRPLLDPAMYMLYGAAAAVLTVSEREVELAEKILGLKLEDEAKDVENFSLSDRSMLKCFEFTTARKTRIPNKLKKIKDSYMKIGIRTEIEKSAYMSNNIATIDLAYLVTTSFSRSMLEALNKKQNNNSFINAAFYSSNECVVWGSEVLGIEETVRRIESLRQEFKNKGSMLVDTFRKCCPDIVSSMDKMCGIDALRVLSVNRPIMKLVSFSIGDSTTLARDDVKKAMMYHQNPQATLCMYPTTNEKRMNFTIAKMKDDYYESRISVPFNVYVAVRYIRQKVISLLPNSIIRNISSVHYTLLEQCMIPNKKVVLSFDKPISRVQNIQRKLENMQDDKVFQLAKFLKTVSYFKEEGDVRAVIEKTDVGGVACEDYLRDMKTIVTGLHPDVRAQLSIMLAVAGIDLDKSSLAKACSFYVYVIRPQESSDGKYKGKGEFLLCYRDRIWGYIDAFDGRTDVYLKSIPTNKIMRTIDSVVTNYFKTHWGYQGLNLNFENKTNVKVILREADYLVTKTTDKLAGIGTNYIYNHEKVYSYEKIYDNKNLQVYSGIKEVNEKGQIIDVAGNKVGSLGFGVKFDDSSFDFTYDNGNGEYLTYKQVKLLMSSEPSMTFEECYLGKTDEEYEEMLDYIITKTGLNSRILFSNALGKTTPADMKEEVKLYGEPDKELVAEEEYENSEEEFEAYMKDMEDVNMDDFLATIENAPLDDSVGLYDEDDYDFGLNDEHGRRNDISRYEARTMVRSTTMAQRFKDTRLDNMLTAYKRTSLVINFRMDTTIKEKLRYYKSLDKKDFPPGAKLMLVLLLMHVSTKPTITQYGAVRLSEAINRIEAFLPTIQHQEEDLFFDILSD